MNEERDNLTKEKIFTTAASLFATRGYYGVSMREISEHSGVSKPTIYYYFGSKEGIYATLVQTGIDHVFGTLEKVKKMDMAAKDKLKELTKRFFFIAWKQPEFAKFFMNIVISDGKFQELDKKFKKEIFKKGNAVLDLIEEGKRNGQFGKDVDSAIAAHILGGTIQHFAFLQFSSEKKILTDELADKIVERIFIGLNE